MAAVKADTLSLTSWQVGMYGWMAVAGLWLFRDLLGIRLEVDSVEFHVSRFQEDARRSSRLAALGWKLLHVTPQAAEDDPSEVVGWMRDALQSSPRQRCAPRLVEWAPVPASVIRGAA